jgi:hypothetical protein
LGRVTYRTTFLHEQRFTSDRRRRTRRDTTSRRTPARASQRPSILRVDYGTRTQRDRLILGVERDALERLMSGIQIGQEIVRERPTLCTAPALAAKPGANLCPLGFEAMTARTHDGLRRFARIGGKQVAKIQMRWDDTVDIRFLDAE